VLNQASETEDFYDPLASDYHLIFQDWNASIKRQGEVLSKLLLPPESMGRVLDCACGIGTQTIALASLGYRVAGSDLSAIEVKRAQDEAVQRGLEIDFRVDDMRELATAETGQFGAVLAFDNSIPHLDSDSDLLLALTAMHRILRSGGLVLLSVRDYAPLIAEHKATTPPVFFMDGKHRRIVHQIWDWHDDRRYTVHLFITREVAGQPSEKWETKHFVGKYRAVTPLEIVGLARQVGFTDLQVLEPERTGFYQPIIIGSKRLE
jgi:glycine/sarcosine N-methyltransferase